MLDGPRGEARSSAETKARIVAVAQTVFSEKGYSHAGLREIARLADVAPSLLMKYFGTKAGLFEQALTNAIVPLRTFQEDRERLGTTIVAAVLDPAARMMAPAMIALALGDAESRAVTMRVVEEQIIVPMSDWLGTPAAAAQAFNLLAMTTGFSIFHRNMALDLSPEIRAQSAALFAKALQAVADQS